MNRRHHPTAVHGHQDGNTVCRHHAHRNPGECRDDGIGLRGRVCQGLRGAVRAGEFVRDRDRPNPGFLQITDQHHQIGFRVAEPFLRENRRVSAERSDELDRFGGGGLHGGESHGLIGQHDTDEVQLLAMPLIQFPQHRIVLVVIGGVLVASAYAVA